MELEHTEERPDSSIIEIGPLSAVTIVLGGLAMAFMTYLVSGNVLIGIIAVELPLFCLVAGTKLKKTVEMAEMTSELPDSGFARTAFWVIITSFMTAMLAMIIPTEYVWLSFFTLISPLGFFLIPAMDSWEKARNERFEEWLLENPIPWDEEAWDRQLEQSNRESFMVNLVAPQRQ